MLEVVVWDGIECDVRIDPMRADVSLEGCNESDALQNDENRAARSTSTSFFLARVRPMLGLEGYGSSSDDDDDDIVVDASANARSVEPVPVARPAPASFASLPRPSARRVVTIPAPALARALEDDDSDSDAREAAKRRKTAPEARGTGLSLKAALPKPLRAGRGGGGALDLGTFDEGGRAVGAKSDSIAFASGARAAEEDEDVGPHAAAAYAVGDDGEYVDPTAAYANGGADDDDDDDDDRNERGGLTSGSAREVSFVDRALAEAAKTERERHGRDIKIITLNAADVRKRPGQGTHAPVIENEGVLQQFAATRTSSTARHKHQITSLLHEAKVNEKQILETGSKASATRAANRQRYGW